MLEIEYKASLTLIPNTFGSYIPSPLFLASSTRGLLEGVILTNFVAPSLILFAMSLLPVLSAIVEPKAPTLATVASNAPS